MKVVIQRIRSANVTVNEQIVSEIGNGIVLLWGVKKGDSFEDADNIINKKSLSLMKETAMLINVGRGNAVNEEDLIEALNSNTIACAALDTTKIEPLPNDSELWTANNCFISSHDSAHSLHAILRLNELFCSNLIDFIDKKPLKNLFSPFPGRLTCSLPGSFLDLSGLKALYKAF
mgnify:CR=1 FL=1